MARSSWKGFIRLSLVSVPVAAYTSSSSGGGRISLNQLHDECHSRIKYQKTCPLHGEVTNDEIVMGYEFAKGQYVIVDPDELDALRSEGDRAINIDRFLKPDLVDPLYFAGQAFFLTPDGPAGQKPYALLRQAMSDENLCAVGQIVLYGKEQLVLLRVVENLLTMSSLKYGSEMKLPEAFADEITEASYTREELKLTKTLLEATTTETLDLHAYEDLYTQRMTELIEAKTEGKEIVAPPSEESPPVINLMDALKKSLSQARGGHGKKTAKRASRKMASSQAKRSGRKKKTG